MKQNIKPFEEILRKTPFLGNINHMHDFDKNFPIELIKEITTWEVFHKSPYGKSYYNTTDLNWGYKPDKSLRISDHWNFQTFAHKTKLHCLTTNPCPNDTHWSIGIYNSELKKYEILASFEKKTRTKQENILFKILILPLKIIKSFEVISKQNLEESKEESIKDSILIKGKLTYNELTDKINNER